MQAGTDSFVAADKGFNDARSAQQAAYDIFHADDDALTAWLTKARAVLVTFFGLRWSTQWAQAGYINGSTAVPSTISDRLALALRVTAFFAANPSFEAASLGVTAAIATELRTAAVTSQQAVAAAATDLKQKAATRETAFNTLISKMRLLIGVLGELLNADDPRWLAFGLQIPASLVTPGQPQGLTASASPTSRLTQTAAGMTNVLLTWDAQPMASRYRLRMRVVGLETAFRLVASTTEPMAIVSDVPADSAVEVIVQAVNGSRQGVASEPIIYRALSKAVPTTPDEAPSAATPLELVTVSSNGNGSNGHGKGSRVPARN